MMGFNTLLVLMSVSGLGMVSGMIGTYIMLNKKTLVSDAISHATLPGIALGYFAGTGFGMDNTNNLLFLLSGAAITGAASLLFIYLLRRYLKQHEDAAVAITLSTFFALGVVLFGVVQSLDFGVNRSGLDRFLLGQTSGMTFSDTVIILTLSLVAGVITLGGHKAFLFMGYDFELFAHLSNHSRITSILLSTLMLCVVCLGLKTTGVLLVLALLILPPATARLWCSTGGALVALSSIIGGLGGIIGTILSALLDNAPTGATISLVLFGFFLISLVFYRMKNKAYG
jgi:manganese/zinc/iron transport system permease protein